MPKFEIVEMEELRKYSGVSPQKMRKLEEYMDSISKITPEKGCRVSCEKGESINSVRNNLKKAAQILGKDVVIRRSGNEIIVCLFEGKRRGRRRTKRGTV